MDCTYVPEGESKVEVQEPEEKKRALSAIMAHYEKSRPFAFTDEQTQRVAVFRLDVAQLTCKEHL